TPATLNGQTEGPAQVFLIVSDDGGATWQSPVRVSPVKPYEDGLGDDIRAQFMPQVAVDPQTGSVVVQYYDGRRDAAGKRVTNEIVASIDGGASFSKHVASNELPPIFDAITLQHAFVGPIPDNIGTANPN